MRRFIVVSMVAVVALAGCSTNDDDTPSSTGNPATPISADPGTSTAAPSVSTSSADLPILLVSLGSNGDYGDAIVAGDFEVNAHGCVVIDDWLVIAPPGSMVTADGAVQIAGYAPVAIGDRFDGGGGFGEWPNATELDASIPGAADCVDTEGDSVPVAITAPDEGDAP